MVYLHLMGSATIDNEVKISVLGTQWSKSASIAARQERWEAIPVKFSAGSKRNVRIRIAAKLVEDFSVLSEGRDTRQASVAIKGLYVCPEADSVQRMAILEAIHLGDLELIARRFSRSSTL
jgi:hypothetical protein